MKIEQVNPRLLKPRAGNPAARSDLKAAATWELTASVKKDGIQTPVLVRAKFQGAGKEYTHEIVYGHRRVTAAIAAGLETIPAEIALNMTDEEAEKKAAIENAQREDLHPLDQATEYRALVKTAGGISEAAAWLGKSVSHVRQRLALLQLVPAAAEAFRTGKINAGAAVILASLRSEHQAKAIGEAINRSGGPGELSGLVETLAREAMLRRIKDAPFDAANPKLPGGACALCPKNTAKTADLFGAVSVKDAMCTDGACWGQKAIAHADEQLRVVKAQGRKILSPERGAGMFERAWHGKLARAKDGSGYLALDCALEEYGGGPESQNVKTLLGAAAANPKTHERAKAVLAAAVVTVDALGAVRWLVKSDAAEKVIKDSGALRRSSHGTHRSAETDAGDRAGDRARQEKLEVMRRAYWPAVRDFTAHLLTLPAPKLIALLYKIARPGGVGDHPFEWKKTADPVKNASRQARAKADRDAAAVTDRVQKAPKNDVERLIAVVLGASGGSDWYGPGHMAEDFDREEHRVARLAGFNLKTSLDRARREVAAEIEAKKKTRTKGTQPAKHAAKKGGR